MSSWTVAWIAWIAAFAVIEGFALVNKKPGDTLSENVWRWFAVKGGSRPIWHWTGRLILLIAGIWLTGHLAFGWWSWP